MQLAQRAVLSCDKTLKQHRQQHFARYERVIEKAGKRWRYFSDVPATLYGEFLQAHFDATYQGDQPGRLIYAEKLNDHHWYMASFNPTLEQEAVGALATLSHEFGYALHHAEQIWLTDKDFYLYIDSDPRCQEVPLPDKASLDEYELTLEKKSKLPLLALGAGLVLSLGVLGSIWLTQPSIPETIEQPIDNAKLQYEQNWQEQVGAKDALLSARNLLIQTSLMPTGMSGRSVRKEGRQLMLPITKQGVSRLIENAWIEAQPNLSRYYQSSDALTATLSLPLTALPSWQRYPVTGYRHFLTDGLERLGAKITQKEQQEIEGTLITSLMVSFEKASMGQLSVLGALLDTPYVSLRQLDMEMDEHYHLSTLNFTLDVQGE